LYCLAGGWGGAVQKRLLRSTPGLFYSFEEVNLKTAFLPVTPVSGFAKMVSNFFFTFLFKMAISLEQKR